MLWLISSLSAVGGLVLLDKMAIGEFGISQPIVSCPLIGIIFGEFYTGLFLGSILQLVWIGALPLGSKEPLDNQGAGVVAISTYILVRNINSNIAQEKILFICLLFAGIASIAGQFSSENLKKFNNRLFNRVNQNSKELQIIRTHLTGLFTSFLRGFILSLGFLILSVIMLPLIKLLPYINIRELIILPFAIGIAGIAHLVIFQKRLLFGALGLASGVILWVLLKL